MKKKELKREIKRLVAQKQRNDAMFDKVYNLFGDNKVEECVWETFDIALEYLEERAGDREQLISFFIFDCMCGDSPSKYRGKGKTFKTIDDVVVAIRCLT